MFCDVALDAFLSIHLSGKAAQDGMTPEISAAIKEWADKMVPDEAARKWMYEGGALD